MDQFDLTKALQIFKEREKELNCLYRIDELLEKSDLYKDELFKETIRIIPSGWQYPTVCEVKICFEGNSWESEDFRETEWTQSADLVIDENIAGEITVSYSQLIRMENDSQFLPEEQKLLNNIASRLSSFIFYKRIRKSLNTLETKIPSKNQQVDETDLLLSPVSDEHWKWRIRMAEKIAARVDTTKYGIKAMYIIGSTKHSNAGPASDIDLLIHCENEKPLNDELKAWLNGWSLCLSEVNFIKTGHLVKEGLLDAHFVTDQDVEEKSSFAVMINSPYDKARALKTRE